MVGYAYRHMTVKAQARQYAALPWRRGRRDIEFLLISSRETRRWVIPKGWPIGTFTPQESALQEAFEEAGVAGAIADAPCGVYGYTKRHGDGTAENVSVSVFALEVSLQHEAWPEQDQRTLRWMTREEAAGSVAEPELAGIIREFRAG